MVKVWLRYKTGKLGHSVAFYELKYKNLFKHGEGMTMINIKIRPFCSVSKSWVLVHTISVTLSELFCVLGAQLIYF